MIRKLSIHPLSGRAGGFTLTEVLFAVMILGIGFIMVAALLPVAATQSQATLDDLIGKSMAEAGLGYIQAVASNNSLPETATSATGYAVVSADATVAALKNTWGNRINPTDKRYTWVALYQRPKGAASATVLVLGARCRNKAAYPNTTWSNRDNDPHEVDVALREGGSEPDQVRFNSSNHGQEVAAEGAYLIIANAGDASSAENGRFYRLGSRVPGTTDTWYLAPGNDMPIEPGPDGVYGTSDDILHSLPAAVVKQWPSGTVKAFILGRGLRDPANGYSSSGSSSDNPYEGPAQDLYLVKGTVTW